MIKSMIALLASLGMLLGLCTPSLAARIELTAATEFYFSLSGSDTTGNGSASSPWRTAHYGYEFVKNNYDARGWPVSFKSVDSSGTYPDCFIAVGRIPGWDGPVSIDFNGTTIEPAIGSNCNASTGVMYAFGIGVGEPFINLSNVTMSVCGTWEQDMVNTAKLSRLRVGPNVVYECAFQPWNHNSINGLLTVSNGTTIKARNIATTGTWSVGGSSITVADTTGIRPWFGVTAPGIPADCMVASVVGSVVNLARQINDAPAPCIASSAGLGAAVTFNSGANAHWGIGTFGMVECENNNVPGEILMPVVGGPYFSFGFVSVLQLSQINCGGVTFTNGVGAQGRPFVSEGNSIIYSHGMGVPYFPGSYQQGLTATFTAGSKSATLSAGGHPYVADGAVISDLDSASTCTVTAGSKAITSCTNAPRCFAGGIILGTLGIANGTIIDSVVGGTINISHLPLGSASPVSVFCGSSYVPSGTVIEAGGGGAAITLSQPAIRSGSVPVVIGGMTRFGGRYQ